MSDRELFADRMLSLGLARMSEAIAAAPLIRGGDEKSAAVEAMRTQINLSDMVGIVGGEGEGERDEAPMPYVGEKAGTGNRPAWLSDQFGLTAQGSAASGRRALAREVPRCALAREVPRCALSREAQ